MVGSEVGRLDAAFLWLAAGFCRGAVDLAAADAAAGQGDGEDGAPVVAAAGPVHLRRAAELGHADDQGLAEHAAARQVLQQRGER